MFELPIAESITHQHLLSVVNTLLCNKQHSKDRLRILDAGCGNGHLMSYLHRCLKILHPSMDVRVCGFDVSYHGVQSDDFFLKTIDYLNNISPEVNWKSRLWLLSSTEWDIIEGEFDFIISNQVLEHVSDKRIFFENVKTRLVNGGYSVHLAPLRHVIYEGHIFLPLAHRIQSFRACLSYIFFLSWLGFGKFRSQHRNTGCTIQQYSEKHADYLYFWTNYSSESETIGYVRSAGMRADFTFSMEFFTSKLKQVVRIKPSYTYKLRAYSFFDAIMIKFLRYISSVTLVCEKKNTY